MTKKARLFGARRLEGTGCRRDSPVKVKTRPPRLCRSEDVAKALHNRLERGSGRSSVDRALSPRMKLWYGNGPPVFALFGTCPNACHLQLLRHGDDMKAGALPVLMRAAF